MSESDAEYIHCPHCGRRYRWQATLAGRTVKCGCGAKLRAPQAAGDEVEVLEAPSEDEPETYELAEDPDAGMPQPPPAEAQAGEAGHGGEAQAKRTAADHGNRCPGCNKTLKPEAVICVYCGFNIAEGRPMRTEVGEEEPPDAGGGGPAPAAGGSLIEQQANADQPEERTPHQAQRRREESRQALVEEQQYEKFRRQEYIYPPILLGVGVLLKFIQVWARGGDAVEGVVGALISTALQIGVMVPLLVLTLFAATLFGMAFGSLWTALLKLSGIALVPMAAASLLIGPGLLCFGSLLWLMIVFIAIWAMVTPLFDLDINEALILSAGLMITAIAGRIFAELGIPLLLHLILP